MPMRVAMMHQGQTYCGKRARRRHHGRWRTIGDRIYHQKDIEKYEIKKQVIGEDADLEKSGRRLNRVIKWNHNGITIEADQRHVKEMLKGLELDRANHSATPCAVERKNEGNARSDEIEGENRCEQGQTQTKHEWDGMSDGDDRDRPQMAGDDANDSQAFTGGHITKYIAICRTNQLLVARQTRSQVCINASLLYDWSE